MSSEPESNVISLKGATDIIVDFFFHSANNILYQRGVYPPENFKRISKFGLTMMSAIDEKLLDYLQNIMKQLKVWLIESKVQKLVLVIKGIESSESLERWVFDCESTSNSSENNSAPEKPMKEITQEIQAIIRQITASVTFLPLLNEQCCFDLLVYADNDSMVPMTWEDSDPCIIVNSEEVKLRSFDTKVHKVDVAVAYKVDENGL